MALVRRCARSRGRAAFALEASTACHGQASPPHHAELASRLAPAWVGEALGGNELMYVILKSCCQFVNRMEVRILPKYEPSAAEVKEPEVFAENVRK